MGHVRPRDDHWSPPFTADATTPFTQADPLLLTPNRRGFDTDDTLTNFRYTDKVQPPYPRFATFGFEPLRSKPLFPGFERPNLARIAILAVLCLCAYPALYILTLVARDKTLFTVRLIVAMWCSAVGFALGYVLVKIGVQHLEAASQ